MIKDKKERERYGEGESYSSKGHREIKCPLIMSIDHFTFTGHYYVFIKNIIIVVVVQLKKVKFNHHLLPPTI